MMPEPGVEVVWSALSRSWRKAEHDWLWLQFRPRGSKDVLDAVNAAVEVANRKVEDAGWGESVFVEGVSESGAGPVALMSSAEPEEGVRAWLGAFAEHLQSLGKSGKVTAGPAGSFPHWLADASQLPYQLTAFVSYQTNDLSGLEERDRRRVWWVPAALTARVAEAGVAWGGFEGADVYLYRDTHGIQTKNQDVARPLAQGILKCGMAKVLFVRPGPPRMNRVSFYVQGQACYAVLDDTVPWQARLDKVTRAMVAFPADTDLAFVQHSYAGTITWMDLQTARPPLPIGQEHHIRYNRHLNTGYIPDAHGVQLLTDTHLEHASDLSDWVIQPLGAGRHLVQAKDLQPWYASPDPDPATLAKARADFGNMILTLETIESNPPPWS